MNGTLERGTLDNPFNAATLPAETVHTGGPDRRRSTGRRSSSTGTTDNHVHTDIHKDLAGGDRFQVAPETIDQREEDILRHFTGKKSGVLCLIRSGAAGFQKKLGTGAR